MSRAIERRHASGRPPPLARATLPTTDVLLVSGGDARIALHGPRSTNRYGCLATPDEGLIALGSSTASTISSAGYEAAERLRERLLVAAQSESWSAIYRREMQRIRRELRSACRLSETSGVEVVFAASGTDLHLIAAQLCGGSETAPTLAITVDPSETGSSVPAAMAGRHFSTRAAFCERVEEGAFIPAKRPIDVVTVRLRHDDASVRPAALVDAEIEAWVERAAANRPVLLTVVDVSKTGLLAPSLGCVTRLQRRFPERLDVLIDACQFRISAATVQAYLSRGCTVALTGSKFVTGPAFSGALLIDPKTAGRWRARALPDSLRDYSSSADWPDDWAARPLECVDNFGLLLRWEAALHELSAFRSLPDATISRILEKFARAVRDRLQTDPAFEPLAVPAIDRRGWSERHDWDEIQTIFPFLLRRPDRSGSTRWLDREQTARVHRRLQESSAAVRCQLGQPVACGRRDSVEVSALRLCTSARLVVSAARRGDEVVVADTLRALDRVAALARESTE